MFNVFLNSFIPNLPLALENVIQTILVWITQMVHLHTCYCRPLKTIRWEATRFESALCKSGLLLHFISVFMTVQGSFILAVEWSWRICNWQNMRARECSFVMCPWSQTRASYLCLLAPMVLCDDRDGSWDTELVIGRMQKAYRQILT